MKAGGIGGFEVQPTYALALDNPAKEFRNLPYMSPEFLDMIDLHRREGQGKSGCAWTSRWEAAGPSGGRTFRSPLASPRLRVAATPDMREGESLIAIFQQGKEVRSVDPALGRPQYFIASHTRQTVKRPAVNADGWVARPLRPRRHRAALQIGRRAAAAGSEENAAVCHLQRLARSLQLRLGAELPRGIPEAARLRSSPAAAGVGRRHRPQTGAIRHDWGLTLSELCEDNYLRVLTAWAKQHGTKFRSQTYGIPPVRLSSERLVDLPEGEGTQWRRFSSTRWASSANHLYGRPVTSSETWTWLHSPVFRATPLDMKAEADVHFLQGVNQLIAHGWPYSPPEAGEPGWRFYASGVFNHHNPWWIVMPDVAAYMQRMSWLLRQGKPVDGRRGLFANGGCDGRLRARPRQRESVDGDADWADARAGDS
jgi:hypothetical protein